MAFKTQNKEIKKFLGLFGITVDPIIGIDIGSSAIKVMEIAKENNSYCIQNFAIEPLQAGDVVEKNIKNKEAVSNALKKAISKTKCSSYLGCVSIPTPTAISKIIQLKNGLNEKEVASEIELEADRYIPYALNEVNLDFEMLGPSKIGENLMDILLIASKTDNINGRINILETAGIKPKIVDVEYLSIERVFCQLIAKNLPNGGKEKLVVLLDIGATITSINVFYDLHSIYSKEQSFGGQQLLDEIQKRYGLTFQEAILARKYGNLPEDYSLDVLEPFKNKISQQLARACQLFLSSNSEYHKIDYVCLTGGTSNVQGIDELLQELLHTKVFVINPIANILTADHIPHDALIESASGLLNCCGLALRNCGATL